MSRDPPVTYIIMTSHIHLDQSLYDVGDIKLLSPHTSLQEILVLSLQIYVAPFLLHDLSERNERIELNANSKRHTFRKRGKLNCGFLDLMLQLKSHDLSRPQKLLIDDIDEVLVPTSLPFFSFPSVLGSHRWPSFIGFLCALDANFSRSSMAAAIAFTRPKFSARRRWAS